VILRSIGAFPMTDYSAWSNDVRTRLLVGNALLSIVLYIALIPTYSWRGALVSTLISESSLFASSWADSLSASAGATTSGHAGQQGLVLSPVIEPNRRPRLEAHDMDFTARAQ